MTKTALLIAAIEKANFINYSVTVPYTEANKFELAAYKFGGGIPSEGFSSISCNSQILRRGSWW